MSEKYNTCKHSTGNVVELIVYVHPGCPRLSKTRGSLVSSRIRCQECKIRCQECKSWEGRKDDKS